MKGASAFRAYDIRGIYPDEVDEELAYKVGRAFVSFLSAKSVVVGHDMRKSSVPLMKSLLRGITDQGADAESIGMVPTPVVNFAAARHGFDGGIIISASHNPSRYNAFKLVKKPALQLSSDTGIMDIKNLVDENDFKDPESKGSVSEKNILDEYISYISEKFSRLKTGLKVVADYGNGAGSISAKPVFEKLRIDAVHLFDSPDDSFPNHEANPHDEKNFESLQKSVVRNNADIGIFFDGDADRSHFVDEKGNIVPADIIFCIVMKKGLKENPGANVFYDLRFSRIVPEVVKELGGNPVVTRAGNPFLKEKLSSEGGFLAAEYSGHFMYRENYGIDDGLFAALKLIESIESEKKPLSELAKQYMKYFSTSEINIPTESVNPDRIIEMIKAKFSDGESLELDGAHISYPGWWFLVRKSNTEPLVRLRIEADSEELRDEKAAEVESFIRSAVKGC